MPEQESEARKQKAEKGQELGPTEELIAEDQAKAAIEDQQPPGQEAEVQEQQSETGAPKTALETGQEDRPPWEEEPEQQRAREEERQREQRENEQKENEQREREQREQQQRGQSPTLLDAPQNQGINPYPTRDDNPTSPGREQHQQAIADEAGERSGGVQRTISTKTQLGAVVTMEGVYVVPKYKTVIKEKPIKERGAGRERENSSGRRSREKERDSDQEQQQGRSRTRGRDRDRGMER